MNPELEYGHDGVALGNPGRSGHASGHQPADSQTLTETSAFFASKRAGDDRRIGSQVRVISELSSKANGSDQTRPAYAGARLGAKDGEQVPSEYAGAHSQAGSEVPNASSQHTQLEHFSQAPLADERQTIDLDAVEEPVVIPAESSIVPLEAVVIPAGPAVFAEEARAVSAA